MASSAASSSMRMSLARRSRTMASRKVAKVSGATSKRRTCRRTIASRLGLGSSPGRALATIGSSSRESLPRATSSQAASVSGVATRVSSRKADQQSAPDASAAASVGVHASGYPSWHPRQVAFDFPAHGLEPRHRQNRANPFHVKRLRRPIPTRWRYELPPGVGLRTPDPLWAVINQPRLRRVSDHPNHRECSVVRDCREFARCCAVLQNVTCQRTSGRLIQRQLAARHTLRLEPSRDSSPVDEMNAPIAAFEVLDRDG